MAKVTSVGCRLPHGIIIEHGGVSVTLKGQNSNRIVGTDGNAVNGSYGVTQVDADFFGAWLAANAGFSAVLSGAIFADEKLGELEAKGKEASKRKTGFEPMEQNGDSRAAGVKVTK